MANQAAKDRVAARIRAIDGRHPLKEVPGACVEYAARRRHDGEVAYFNFALAKEMGLVPEEHDERLDSELRRALLETFCIQIINEHDLEHGLEVPERDLCKNTYMATRYLQLQHPDKCGRTSGDGRSLWNGTFRGRGATWDISSCGTGVTRLCPATAHTGRFFKTGSRLASYGCGTAALEEGLGAALMSETFHRNDVPTERVLCIIALPGGLAINVRAARNLIRPSHFFAALKQGDLAWLRGIADHFIDRQIRNGDWPRIRTRRARYGRLAAEMARTFARVTATFESEYIFCWLDWDGDNILASGEIVDYGSVRQFGLFHREYRFDDVDRWSTSIPEQRRKARGIVQAFAQARDFLQTASKRPLDRYRNDATLALFDRTFEICWDRLLLHRVGFDESTAARLLRDHGDAVDAFRVPYRHFERARAARGPRRVPDGLNWNAIFCTRDLLRELPDHFLRDRRALSARAFIDIAASIYASRRDRRVTPYRARMASRFQRAYLDLVDRAARIERRRPSVVLAMLFQRAAVINRYDRITGDSATYATQRLIRQRRRLGPDAIHWVLTRFIASQDRRPETVGPARAERRDASAERALAGLVELMAPYRYGL